MQHSELKKSENAWKRPEEVSKDLPEEEKETQVITCITLSIAMYILTYIVVSLITFLFSVGHTISKF